MISWRLVGEQELNLDIVYPAGVELGVGLVDMT